MALVTKVTTVEQIGNFAFVIRIETPLAELQTLTFHTTLFSVPHACLTGAREKLRLERGSANEIIAIFGIYSGHICYNYDFEMFVSASEM